MQVYMSRWSALISSPNIIALKDQRWSTNTQLTAQASAIHLFHASYWVFTSSCLFWTVFLWSFVYLSHVLVYFGMRPLSAVVSTRFLFTCLVGNPYQSFFPTVCGTGSIPKCSLSWFKGAAVVFGVPVSEILTDSEVQSNLTEKTHAGIKGWVACHECMQIYVHAYDIYIYIYAFEGPNAMLVRPARDVADAVT